MLKILGILDLITGTAMLLTKLGLSRTIVFVLAIIVLIKSIFFIKDFISWLDIIAIAIIFTSLIGNFWIITWIASIWLIQKGIFSLF